MTIIIILHLIGIVIGAFGFGMVYEDYRSGRATRWITIPFMIMFLAATGALIFNIFAPIL